VKNLYGKVHRFGDNINTDYIISGKYKFKTLDMNELAHHVMEDIRPDFYNEVEKGDFIVAGENFGGGSSREQAPLVIQAAGVGAVLAKSFARIFFRNAINVGLPVVECDTSDIEEGDELKIDLVGGWVQNVTKDKKMPSTPLPEVMVRILNAGGLAEYLKKEGSL
jgi:3-isopropylmalate/(R)-2-methylmalate dehydratase small subunit